MTHNGRTRSRFSARRAYPAYEEDFAAWLQAQADLLRERRFDELDIPNLVEEVEAWAEVSFEPSERSRADHLPYDEMGLPG
jgi:hypothetical protein